MHPLAYIHLFLYIVGALCFTANAIYMWRRHLKRAAVGARRETSGRWIQTAAAALFWSAAVAVVIGHR